MQSFELADIVRQRQGAGRPYLEFLRVPVLSLGLSHRTAKTRSTTWPAVVRG